MKNKHLVFLFLFTLLIGLAVRRAPWRDTAFFQANLLKADTAAVQRIDIASPGHHGLILMRNELGWEAEQQGRSTRVPPDIAQKILAELGGLRSIRIVKTDRPDTLGFSQGTAIKMVVYYSNKETDFLSIGWETIENGQPATFVLLRRHEGIYLAENQLRAIFSKTLKDFRNAAAIKFNTADVRNFSIYGQNLDSLCFQKNDALGSWVSPLLGRTVSDSSVQKWLVKIASLQKLPFADLYDESHANKTFFTEIKFGLGGQTAPLNLKIYRFKTTNLPEEMPDKPLDRSLFAPYVLYFSQYPTNYFALSDTSLLRQICRPF